MKMTTDKALKRAEIYNILLGIKQGGSHDMREVELDGMLLHFAPKPARIAKTGMQWLAKAVAGKSEQRKPLRLIYCDESRAYASDGQRAHSIPAGDLVHGYYCPKTLLPVDPPSYYPDVWRVFEKPAGLGTEVSLADCEVAICGRQVNYVLSQTEKASASKKYIDDATNGDAETMLLACQGKIFGKSKFGEFVVIGLRP